MSEIWTGRSGRIYYSTTGNTFSLSYTEIGEFSFEYDHHICAYCGHDMGVYLACPGCSARKSTNSPLTSGRASVVISGMLPRESWLLRDMPEVIEYHVISPCDYDDYDSYRGRIVMRNICVTDRELTGLGVWDDEPLKAVVQFTCTAVIEVANE